MAEIPNDLWPEILLNLPAVSVARFRSLSKFHQKLIDDHDFRRRYSDSRTIKQNQTYVILNYCYNNTADLVHFDSTNLNSLGKVHKLIKPSGKRVQTAQNKLSWQNFQTAQIIGYCKGIVCLRNESNCIMFWNPLTGSCRCIQGCIRHIQDHSQCYFGHDAVSDDLKLVIFQQEKCSLDDIVKIYSLKTDCWNEVESNIDDYGIMTNEYCNDVVEGANALHIAFKDISLDGLIVAFDFSTETFSEVWCPDSLWSGRLRYPSSLNGCLCFHEVEYGVCRTVWMMKEYGVKESWTRLISLDDKVKILRALEFTRDGSGVLLLGYNSYGWGFYVYDLEKKMLKMFEKLSNHELSRLDYTSPRVYENPYIRESCENSYLYTPCLNDPKSMMQK